MPKRGKLIVIDGSSGSGKETQSRMIQKYLKTRSIPFKYYDFPRYDTFWGNMVGRFLRGEFGDLHQVSPYLSSLLYAQDRAVSAREMNKWLQKGGHIICNRYVSSSVAHQGAKFQNLRARNEFVKWLEYFEYSINNMPKEDAVIYLNVPVNIIVQLIDKKGKRKYLKGQKTDIEERNRSYLLSVEHMFKSLAMHKPTWHIVNCAPRGKLLSIECISKKVIGIVNDLLEID